FEGANVVLLQLVARGLLTGYRAQFQEMRVWAVVRYVTARATTRVAELNPVITRKTDADHLQDPEFHANALRYRESRLLHTLAARMRSLISEGRDSFDAVNECQDHMVKLAHAYSERIVLESFQQRVERARDEHVRECMNSLCAVYALDCIERDKGWFLES